MKSVMLGIGNGYADFCIEQIHIIFIFQIDKK